MANTSKQDPVETLVATVRSGRDPSRAESDAVLAILRVWLSRRGLAAEDREEVCSDALRRLIKVAREGSLDRRRPAGAWLRVVADHLAIDVLRRTRSERAAPFDEQFHASGSEDDRLAALLDRHAAISDVRRALREAADAGQETVVAVIPVWLGLAEANGEAPSSREVAARLGISHMTVQRALEAFGRLLSA